MPKQPKEIATQMQAARQGAALLDEIFKTSWAYARSMDAADLRALQEQFRRLDAKEQAQSERNRKNGKRGGGRKPAAGRKRKEGA